MSHFRDLFGKKKNSKATNSLSKEQAINKNRRMIKQFYRFLVFLISFARKCFKQTNGRWIQKSSIISMNPATLVATIGPVLGRWTSKSTV